MPARKSALVPVVICLALIAFTMDGHTAKSAGLSLGLMPFEKQGNVSDAFTDTLMELVKVELSKNRAIKLIALGKDREGALRELEVQQSGLYDPKTVIDAGGFQGAQKILRGKVSRLSSATYLSLHVIDLRTGVYDLSRKVTICAEADAEEKVARIMKSVARGLEGEYFEPETGGRSCDTGTQSVATSGFAAIHEKDRLREVPVLHVTASSILTEPGFNHNPWVMLDGVVETAWADGKENAGAAGESLTFFFPGGVTIDEIAIVNGLGVTEGQWGDLFDANASIETARVDYAQGDGANIQSETITLRKTPQMQRVKLFFARGISTLRITILTEFPGARYRDTCISEIRFYGR